MKSPKMIREVSAEIFVNYFARTYFFAISDCFGKKLLMKMQQTIHQKFQGSLL